MSFMGVIHFAVSGFVLGRHVLLEDGIVILKHVGVDVTLMSHIHCKCIYLVHEMKVLIQNAWSKEFYNRYFHVD